MEYLITKEDVEVINHDHDCEECEDKPANHHVTIDLRAIGKKIGVGLYCEACANMIAGRIRRGLPKYKDGEN